MDPLWYKMTEEDKEEARAYSVYLQEQWTPLEKYIEACRVLESFPKPCANDVTPAEVRVKKRDEAYELIHGKNNEQEKETADSPVQQ